MGDRSSSFAAMAGALLGVTLVSGLILGGVYELTSSAKEAAELARKTEALRRVLPVFDNDPVTEAFTRKVAGEAVTFYPARKAGRLVGLAVESVSHKGFAGDIRLLVGFRQDGTITDVVVLSHQETPGLGDKIDPAKSPFSRQFRGRNPARFRLRVKQDGGDVDGITAATISSRAFCDGVRKAYQAFTSAGLFEEGGMHEAVG